MNIYFSHPQFTDRAQSPYNALWPARVYKYGDAAAGRRWKIRQLYNCIIKRAAAAAASGSALLCRASSRTERQSSNCIYYSAGAAGQRDKPDASRERDVFPLLRVAAWISGPTKYEFWARASGFLVSWISRDFALWCSCPVAVLLLICRVGFGEIFPWAVKVYWRSNFW